MAFRISGVTNYITDKGLSTSQIEAIQARAKAAAEDFDEDGTMFSGGAINKVLGDPALVADYMKQREGNLNRYT